jgi:glycosyltransferase involved in cell wall biosynthesis
MQFVNTLAVSDGGPARNSFELNQAFNRVQGVRAQLVSVGGAYSESVVADTVKGSLPAQHPRWLSGGDRSLRFSQLIRMMRSADAVVIHGYFLPWIPPLAVACRVLGKSVFLTPHGSLTAHQQRASPVRKRAYEYVVGRILRRALSSFVVGSEAEMRDIAALYPRNTCFVGGVGTMLPTPPIEQPEQHAPLRLLSVSRLTAKKNIEVMLHAVRILLDRGHQTHLTVAGTGKPEYEAALRNLAVDLGLEGHVTFAGSVTGLAKGNLYRQSDVFLLPSDDENFGIGVAESLAYGSLCHRG